MSSTFTKRDFAAFLFNIFIFVSELIVVITKLHTADGSEFSYYTFLSNLTGMAAAFIFMLSFFSRFKRFSKAKTILRFYATCMLSFTLLIVVFVLTPMAMSVEMDPSFLFTGFAAFTQHIANPVISFISFVFFEDNRSLKKKQPLLMLLLCICYTFILITLNIIRVVDGPYPFFQVYYYPPWAIILWIVGLAGFNYIMNYLIFRAGTRKKR